MRFHHTNTRQSYSYSSPVRFDEIVLEQRSRRDSAMLQLIVYLPDRSPVKVKLLDDGTMMTQSNWSCESMGNWE